MDVLVATQESAVSQFVPLYPSAHEQEQDTVFPPIVPLLSQKMLPSVPSLKELEVATHLWVSGS